MSDKPILYNLNLSPPVRCVKVVARLVNLELDVRDLDVFNGEHLQESFTSINPEHTVPTYIEDGNVLWDSHVISTYIVDKYREEDDSLYPKDLYLRGRCNQRLFFNNGRLFKCFQNLTKHIFGGGDSIPEDHITSTHDIYDMLESFLKCDPFLVGDHLTIADISNSITMTILTKFIPIEEERYPQITAWMNRVKETIEFFDEINEEPTNELYEMITNKMESNKNTE